MIVCLCKAVSESEIHQSMDDGMDSFPKLQNSLSVGTQCGSCVCEVKEILKKRARKQKAQSSLLQSSLTVNPASKLSTV